VQSPGSAAWPDEALYRPAWHVPFQLDAMARCTVLRQAMLCYDLGTGKTHIAMGTIGLAFEAGDIDLALIVCEKGKPGEWLEEFQAATALERVFIYYGPRRAKVLEKSPQVLITTYGTSRRDLMKLDGQKKLPGPLLEYLKGRRVMVVYDEITVLKDRSQKSRPEPGQAPKRASATYRAHQFMLAELRKLHRDMRVLGLTGYPIESSYEDAFYEFRLIWPQGMPTVKHFNEYFVACRDPWDRPRFHEERMPEFRALCAPRMLRKRKTDPDVAAQFPERTEEFVRCEMSPRQAQLYRMLEDLAWDEEAGDFVPVPGLQTVLRQFAGHPAALLESARHGTSALAKMLAEEAGAQLAACPSAKEDRLREDLGMITSQGMKAIVFTFYGQSVLQVLARSLSGYPGLYVHHGGLSEAARARVKSGFRSHQGGAVFLSSDAGARGINLPEASYVIEYESALSHANRMQRFSRAHRLGQGGTVTCLTFTLENTIESRLISLALGRNAQSDLLLGDEGAENHLSAADRRSLYSCARRRKAA
jgi:SNF2 family DNA or RNA helicase